MNKYLRLNLIGLSLAACAGGANAIVGFEYTPEIWKNLLSEIENSKGANTPFSLYSIAGEVIPQTTVAALRSVPPTSTAAYIGEINRVLGTPSCSGAKFIPSTLTIDTGTGAGSATCLQGLYNAYKILASTPDAIVSSVNTQIQRATSVQQATTISNALSSTSNRSAFSGPRRVALGNKGGMAAGDETPAWNAWFNVSDSDIGNKSNYDGSVQNYIGGIDYALNKKLVVGLSLGQDRAKVDLASFNMNSSGLMLAPYVSYQFDDTYSADASLGYAKGDIRYSSAPNGSQDFSRNFAAINLNGNWWFDDWQLSGKTSYISAAERTKDFSTFVGNNNRMEQIRLGAQLGYWTQNVMPYVGVTYINDIKTPATPDGSAILTDKPGKNAVSLSVGVNLFANKTLLGGIVYSSEQRSNSKNNTLMANIGYRF